MLPLLVIRPRRVAAHGGDEVVYRHTLRYLEQALPNPIETVELHPVGGLNKLRHLLCLPPEITAFETPANHRAVADALAARRYAAVLLFNEITFPTLPDVLRAGVPAILVAHNVQSVVASSDASPLVRLGAIVARRFERRIYGDPRAALSCISLTDVDGLKAAGVLRDDIVVVPPGAPPAAALAEGAPVIAEAVMTGSYGWWRKRRDLKRLATEPDALGCPILANDADALAALGARGVPMPADIDWTAGVRFGIVSDRFLGGFKLKVLEYVANNCVVLSYCNLAREFEGLPHAGEMVRHISSLSEARAAMRAAQADPGFVERFRAFKTACLDRYRWDLCLEPLASLTARVAAG
jgi:hypothetical protein